MSRILILPGSKWQMKLAEKIKDMGHWLCVVSPEENPPCAKLADNFFRSDIFDIESIAKYAKEINIEAIVSDECDIAMPVVAELGERLGLNTLSRDSASLYTDKFLMREFCNKNKLKIPEYKLCKTANEVIRFFEEINRPIIIKPLDSNASHGVFKIEKVEEILKHFDEALSFSRVEKAVLAERYIDGIEFTIDSIKTPNKNYTLAISEKKHFTHNASIANELYFTHSNENYDYNKLKKTNDTFIMLSPLKFGFTHAEYKYENGEFYLIEIGSRGGGNMISSVITQYMSGYDTYEYLINCSIGNIEEKNFSIRRDYLNRSAILKFFKTPEGGGKVKKIKGLDFIDLEKDVVEFQLNFKIGDEIEDAKNDSARIGFYIACSQNKEKLDKVKKEIENKFEIVIE